MSTSQIEQPQAKTPRPYMSLTEVLIGAAFLLSLFLIGPIGFYTLDWSEEKASLISAAGVIGGLVIWAGVHALLIAKGIIRPIDTSLQYQQGPKPYGRR